MSSQGGVQAFEQKIVKTIEKHGPMTMDRCCKLIRPDCDPGGYADFIHAFKNLTDSGRLTKQGESERAPKWGLA